MPTEAKTILFAGGGSGGHISPLLAVMEAVQVADSTIRCVYVGLQSDLQSPIILESKLSFEKHAIRSGKLHRFISFDQLRQTGRMVAGLWEAYKLLGKIKPDLVFCKGSMVSVPIALAAKRRNIPVYSHETDVVPGIANRIIAKFAKGIFTAYPLEAYKGLPAEKLIYTGQPVQPEFYSPQPKKKIIVGGRELGTKRPIITVIGGSQGAHRINELVRGCWWELLEEVQIVHICGSRDFSWLDKDSSHLQAEHAEHLFLTDFQSEDVPELFAASSVVISRAGGTVFELAAIGAPTVLVPLSTAAQNHQHENAVFIEGHGAALTVDEKNCTPSQLATVVRELVANASQRERLSKAIKKLDHPDAAQKMAHTLLKAN